jgi:thioredoxin-like negative regulator of GroEL
MRLDIRIFPGFAWLLLVSPLAGAAPPATLPDLVQAVDGESLKVKAPSGHHFNVDAPYSAKLAGKNLPARITPAQMSADLPADAAGKKIEARVFICDDAKTFCLKKSQTFEIPADWKPSGVAKAPHASARKTVGPAVPHLDPQSGFIVNDPEKALAEAKKSQLPLIIDFFGIWCPPCNSLEATVLRTPAFRKAAEGRFVRLQLDADAPFSAALKSKYKIQGLPTMIFATSRGDEILRVVGFQPLKEVLARMDTSYASRSEGYAELKTKASGANAEARFKAALIAMDRDEPAKALEWLAPLEEMLSKAKDPRRAALYRARLGVAEIKKDRSATRAALTEWVKEYPEAVSHVENLPRLAEMAAEDGDKAGEAEWLGKAIALMDSLLAEPDRLRGTYYTPSELAEERADLIERKGDANAAQLAYIACAEAFTKDAQAEAAGDPAVFARGPSLEIAYCLGKAGKTEEADRIYEEGIRRFPSEYTFYAGRAKLWLAKDSRKAAEFSEKALANAYGPQRLKAAATRAKALGNLGLPAQAAIVLEQELAVPQPKPVSPGSVKLIAKLRELKLALKSGAAGTASGPATAPVPSPAQ